jgi:hypothetical protein
LRRITCTAEIAARSAARCAFARAQRLAAPEQDEHASEQRRQYAEHQQGGLA